MGRSPYRGQLQADLDPKYGDRDSQKPGTHTSFPWVECLVGAACEPFRANGMWRKRRMHPETPPNNNIVTYPPRSVKDRTKISVYKNLFREPPEMGIVSAPLTHFTLQHSPAFFNSTPTSSQLFIHSFKQFINQTNQPLATMLRLNLILASLLGAASLTLANPIEVQPQGRATTPCGPGLPACHAAEICWLFGPENKEGVCIEKMPTFTDVPTVPKLRARSGGEPCGPKLPCEEGLDCKPIGQCEGPARLCEGVCVPAVFNTMLTVTVTASSTRVTPFPMPTFS